jgi:hypothetical protein
VLGKLMNLTRAESRVAYAWMNDRDGDELLEQLPEDSRQVLREMKAKVDELSREAVRLGQLSADAYERNKMAYLHRSYRKYELEATKQDRAARGRAVRILGDQYKGRGMTDAAPMAKIKNGAPEWWGRKLREGKGDKGSSARCSSARAPREPRRGRRRAARHGGDEQPGKLREVAYWPASEAGAGALRRLDARRRRVEGHGHQGRQGHHVARLHARRAHPHGRDRRGPLRRGEDHAADDPRHRGRQVSRMAGQPPQPRSRTTAAARRQGRRGAREPVPHLHKDEWVRVPDATIGGTQVKKYGKLAGLYIPGPIWNDVRQVVNHRYTPLGETYATLLRAWKISKTALSPAVHLNNVMANVVMADWHDVLAADLVRALRVMVTSERREQEAARNLRGQRRHAGHVRARRAPTRTAQAAGRGAAARGRAGRGRSDGERRRRPAGAARRAYREAFAAAAGGKAAQLGKKAAGAMIDLYQAEDTVFRLAAFLKAKAEGKSDAEAGKVARRSFLDYSINAPWIQMMRATVFPFISFVYRAAPMMLETYARKPWKLMKLWIVLGGLNALGYMLRRRRGQGAQAAAEGEAGPHPRLLPPKLIRMPWNDAHGSPVFLDVRRFIPVGDVFDLGQTHAALPWLPVAIPGGPLAVALELYANRSQFTGKEITHESDTPREVARRSSTTSSRPWRRTCRSCPAPTPSRTSPTPARARPTPSAARSRCRRPWRRRRA